MSSSTVHFTRHRPEHDQEINALYNEAFGFRRTLEEWHWKFRQNPLSELAELHDLVQGDRIVGHAAYLPARFKLFKREVLSCQASDHGVRPPFKLGRSAKHLIMGMKKDLYEALTRQGFAFIYGMPNALGYILGRLTAGVEEIMEIPIWNQWLNPYGHLMGRVSSTSLRRAGREISRVSHLLKAVPGALAFGERERILPLEQPDDRFDRLWERVSPGFGIACVRDRKYLTWRYYNKPGRPYAVWTFQKAGETEGYVVIETKEEEVRTGYVMDLLCRPDRRAMATLLRHTMTRLAREKVDRVRCLATEGSPMADALQDLGFRRERKGIKMIGTLLDRSLDPDSFTRPGNWHLTYGDLDGT
jgi:hypothetical protein